MSSTLMINKNQPTVTLDSILKPDDRTSSTKTKSFSKMSSEDISLKEIEKQHHRNYHFYFWQNNETVSDSDSDKSNVDFDIHKVDLAGEGSISYVLKAIDLKNGSSLALKLFRIPPHEAPLYLQEMKEMVNVLKWLFERNKYFVHYKQCLIDEDTWELGVLMSPVPAHYITIKESIEAYGFFEESVIQKLV